MTLNEAGVRQSWVDYDWEQLLEHRSSKLSPAPPWLLYKVQQLRPACRAEWELIVFARLCVEEAIACRANRAKGRAGARPLTVGEIESNWSESCGLRDLLLARWVPNIKDLQEAMADSRRQSSCSLLEETKFFGEVLELVHLAVASGAVEESVHCITSRDQLSAVQSLQMSGECIEDLSSPPDHQGSWAGKDGWKLHSNLGTVEEKVAAVHSIPSRGYGDYWLQSSFDSNPPSGIPCPSLPILAQCAHFTACIYCCSKLRRLAQPEASPIWFGVVTLHLFDHVLLCLRPKEKSAWGESGDSGWLRCLSASLCCRAQLWRS